MTAKLITYNKCSDSWGTFDKIAAKCIQIWTGSEFFHSELIIDNKRITSHTNKGVTISNYSDINNIKENAVIQEIKIDKLKIQSALDFAYSQEGKKYDWKGIFFSQFLPLSSHNPNKWFCSEICAEVLVKVGVHFNKKPNEFNPKELHHLFD